MTWNAFRDYILGLMGEYSAEYIDPAEENPWLSQLTGQLETLTYNALMEIRAMTELYRVLVDIRNLEQITDDVSGYAVRLPADCDASHPGENWRGDPCIVDEMGHVLKRVPTGTDEILCLPPNFYHGFGAYGAYLSYRRTISQAGRHVPDLDGVECTCAEGCRACYGPDGPTEAVLTAGYYVASQLLLQEDAYVSGVLRQEYHRRLRALQDLSRYAVKTRVHNIYGF